MSMGVSDFPNNGQTHQEVLKTADEAMYFSKKNGRNRVTAATALADTIKAAS